MLLCQEPGRAGSLTSQCVLKLLCALQRLAEVLGRAAGLKWPGQSRMSYCVAMIRAPSCCSVRDRRKKKLDLRSEMPWSQPLQLRGEQPRGVPRHSWLSPRHSQSPSQANVAASASSSYLYNCFAGTDGISPHITRSRHFMSSTLFPKFMPALSVFLLRLVLFACIHQLARGRQQPQAKTWSIKELADETTYFESKRGHASGSVLASAAGESG